MSDREGQFVLKIQLTHNRKSERKHWTPNCERITVTGPGIEPTILFNYGEIPTTTPNKFVAELLRAWGERDFYLVRAWSDAESTWTGVAFVEKFKDDDYTINPFKVFEMVVGQGPIHAGDVLCMDYEAETPEDAVRNAYRDGKLR